MKGLAEFWSDEPSSGKTNNRRAKVLKLTPGKLLAGLFLVGLVVFYLGRSSTELFPEELESWQSLKDLPEAKLPEIRIKGLSDQEWETEASPAAQLRVISANLVGIYEQITPSPQASALGEATSSGSQATLSAQTSALSQPQVRLAGIRILGEIKNVGQKPAFDATPIVQFYKNEALTATKIGQWSQGYQFVPLEPGKTSVYEVVVAEPPASQSVSIKFKPKAVPEDERSGFSSEVDLLVKERELEPASFQRGQQEVGYYQFKGLLTNKGTQEIVSPGIYVWLRTEEGKVVGFGGRIYENDLFMPGREMEVNLAIIPAVEDEVFDFQVRTFGKRL